jgi:phenylpropionate dioxygenase-like ring-hydroxylating dioxygenase large terminal subunit
MSINMNDSAAPYDLKNSVKTDLLAPWTYESEEFFKLEIETLFKPNWLFAGHISDLTKAGDFVTFDAFNERVVIIRNKTGAINAFHNVCRHRAGRVVKDSQGNCPGAMVCPFHGWSYSLDGKLQGVPAVGTFENLNKAEIGLAAVELEIWMGFIFIRLISGGESLAQMMAPVAEEVSQYQPEQLQPLDAVESEVKPYNWKAIHDIDNEGYHVPIGHPSLHQLYGQDYVDTIEDGIMVSRGTISSRPARNWSVRHYQKLLPNFEHLPESKQKTWYYVQHFPNLIFAFYPDMMEIYMTIPQSPTTTLYVSRSFALPDNRREVRAARFLNKRINQETADEDDSFVGWLQEGMKSSAWTPPHLSSLEHGVRHYHHRIQAQLPVARLAQQPLHTNLADINRQLIDDNI